MPQPHSGTWACSSRSLLHTDPQSIPVLWGAACSKCQVLHIQAARALGSLISSWVFKQHEGRGCKRESCLPPKPQKHYLMRNPNDTPQTKYMSPFKSVRGKKIIIIAFLLANIYKSFRTQFGLTFLLEASRPKPCGS